MTHVDASRQALAWARENAALSEGLGEGKACAGCSTTRSRSCAAKCERGRTYDAALMDPPAFGHTPRGGIWRVDDQLEPLVADVLSLLPDPVFFLINHYAREADGRELARVVTPHLPPALRSRGSDSDGEGGHAEHGVLRLKDGRPAARSTPASMRWRSDLGVTQTGGGLARNAE